MMDGMQLGRSAQPGWAYRASVRTSHKGLVALPRQALKWELMDELVP